MKLFRDPTGTLIEPGIIEGTPPLEMVRQLTGHVEDIVKTLTPLLK
jgi:hypothetical protein